VKGFNETSLTVIVAIGSMRCLKEEFVQEKLNSGQEKEFDDSVKKRIGMMQLLGCPAVFLLQLAATAVWGWGRADPRSANRTNSENGN
jgi:hypothetical protein